jgi:hypothetical protein
MKSFPLPLILAYEIDFSPIETLKILSTHDVCFGHSLLCKNNCFWAFLIFPIVLPTMLPNDLSLKKYKTFLTLVLLVMFPMRFCP